MYKNTVEIWHEHKNNGEQKMVTAQNGEFHGENVKLVGRDHTDGHLREDGVETFDAEKGYEFVAQEKDDTVVLYCVPEVC